MPGKQEMEIIQALTADQIGQARDLFSEYFEFLAHDHELDIGYQGIAEELASLPGDFVPPNGRLLLAVEEETALGCAALHPLEPGICEMKRMYVRPEFRAHGVGTALAKRLIYEAGEIGYHIMRLDTGNFLTAALKLYQSLGFKIIEPYHEVPEEIRKIAVFMELELQEA
jgi:putative acetyltransferase